VAQNRELLRKVLEEEAQALLEASKRIDSSFENQLHELFTDLKTTGGALIFTGVGKSGLVGQKIASTFSSLGLNSFFLHPVEALHGDLGRVSKADVVVLISKSGESEEVAKLTRYLDLPKKQIIGLLGNMNSSLAKQCSFVLDCAVEKEACLNNQAPTTSTTLTMAMGDAMGVVYESLVGLSQENFVLNHPGGSLGKSLLLKVESLMVPSSDCPSVTPGSTLKDVVLSMTNQPIGMCAVIEDGKMMGIIVEGDIRRALTKDDDALAMSVVEVMTADPITIPKNTLAIEALKIMENRERPISVLPVFEEGVFIGALRLHDLLKEGLK